MTFTLAAPFMRVHSPSEADRIASAWALARGFHSSAVLPIIATVSHELRAFYVRDEEVKP